MAARWFLTLILAALCVSSLSAQEDQFREGEHYRVIQTPLESTSTESTAVEVVELFSYACIHCYNFEEELMAWVETQGDDIEFKRVHVVFSQPSYNLAKAYFTAEQLDVVDKVHNWIYEAIHINQLRMHQKELLIRLFESRGHVSAEKFESVFDSFGVQNEIRKSDQLLRVWRIQSTPSLVVGGKYIAGGTHVRSNSELLPIAEFLVDKVNAERSNEH